MFSKSKLNFLYHLFQWLQIFFNQWKSSDGLLRLQNTKLRKVVSHAYANVSYYRKLFDSLGIKPKDIASMRDLVKIPILTKDIILANYPDKILAAGVDWKHCSPRMTSGSSGKKLQVVLDLNVAAQYRMMQLRQLIDVGYKPWDRIVYIRYAPPVTKVVLQKLGLFRRYYVPLEWPPERQLSEILRFKPQIINAYPSALHLLARTVTRDQAKKLRLKFLLSNSELLTRHIRESLEEVFQCKVYDDYSCLEFSAIAFECRMQSLHIASDNVIVEILDGDGNQLPPGEQGRIVITALNNYAMPYIRYEIGDIGILSDEICPCGRRFPVLKSIVGRCDDFVVMPSGRLIDPQTAVFQIEVIPEVKEFRVIQGKDYKITVNIITQEGAEFVRIEDQIKKKLGSVFNDSLRVDVNQVSILERGTTGKHRSVISHIARVGYKDSYLPSLLRGG